MRTLILLLVSLLPAAAAFPYPPKIEDARQEVYRTVEGTELRVWIFEPVGGGKKRPAIVFFFGGGWNGGSPTQFERQCRHLAERGMVAMAADYRVRSRQGAKPVDCVTDAKACVAWVRKNAKRLGVDPQRIAAAGGSAGGHMAACTGTVEGFGSDERPNAMVLFNPGVVVGPWEGESLGGFGSKVTKEKLGAEPEAISPAHHIGKHTPPTLILHGKKDTTVPYRSVEIFAEEMKKAGRKCELVGYEGQGHGFFNKDPWYGKTVAEMDGFLVELGWIGGK